MKVIFADTFYWIALINPRDNWHTIALDYAQKYADDYLITTDGIIDETLNYFATKGAIMRRKALATYLQICQESNMEIISYTPQLRQAGFQLFDERPDKGYSLTDCISMIVMKQRGIRSLAKVIKIYPFVGNEVRNCRYQQSNSISDQIAVCDFCILMKVSEIF